METSHSSNQDALQKLQIIEPQELPPVNLEVLQFIKDSQLQHGLRHGDYRRYRQYCSRRLRRIRKALKFLHGRRGFVQKPIDWSVITDDKFLHLLLIKSERCWAYAMDLKQFANEQPRKRIGFLKKLKKAVQYAQCLEALCLEEGKCHARTVLEVQAYSKWMSGYFLFESQQYHTAYHALSKSKSIYERLSVVCAYSQRALFEAKLAEITPLLKYCFYSMTDAQKSNLEVKQTEDLSAMDILALQLDQILQPTSQTSTQAVDINWRGKSIPIKSEKLRLHVLRIQQHTMEINQVAASSSEKLDLYDKLLLAYSEARQTVRDDLKSAEPQNSSKDTKFVSQKSETNFSHLQFLESYFSYSQLCSTLDRNALLIESAKKRFDSSPSTRSSCASDIARLYELLYQNINELLLLPLVLEESELKNQFIADATASKAWRCRYLAELYLIETSFSEALCLLERAATYASAAIGHYHRVTTTSDGKTNLSISKKIEELTAFLSLIRGLNCSTKASFFLQTHQQKLKPPQKSSLKAYIYESLDDPVDIKPADWVKSPNLVAMPPEFQPVAYKPLFFDVAFDSIEFPPALLQKSKESTTGGITSFVKGLWGWSSTAS